MPEPMPLEIARLLEALPPDPGPEAFARPPLDTSGPASSRPVPAGRVRRLFALGSLQARVAAAYALLRAREVFATPAERERLRAETHLGTAMRLLDSMGYLRGAILKAGQVLAAWPGIAPAPFAEVLGSLHFEAPPMHYALVRERLRDELGGDPAEVFAEFETRPFAAASLGQVHRARLRTGEAVAVKVQYPGIARAVEADMANLQALLRAMPFLEDGGNLRASARDAARVLARETDYGAEADATEEARRLLADREEIVVPRVHRRHSTRRVLTLDLLPGEHLPAWLAGDPPGEARDRHGAAILRAATRLYYAARVLLADPNPGNFLFLPDGRTGLLDFGCSPRFDDDAWEAVLAILRSGGREGPELDGALRRCALLSPGDGASPGHLAALRRSTAWIWEPLRAEVFDYGDPAFFARGIASLREILENRYTRQMPVFTWQARSFYGVRALLFRMGARVPFRRIHDEEAVRAGLDPGPGRG